MDFKFNLGIAMCRNRFFLITFLFHIAVLFGKDDSSNEDIMTKLRCAPSSIVNGSVNVITGQYCETATDIRMAGVSGLTFERSVGGAVFAGWNINLQGSLSFEVNAYSQLSKNWKYQFIYTGAHGQTEKFHHRLYSFFEKSSRKLPNRIECSQNNTKKGFTNTAAGYISGQTNIKNNHINYDYWAREAEYVNGQGEKHCFDGVRKDSVSWLYKIIFPNTLQWHYEYENTKKVKAVNANNDLLGWISFERIPQYDSSKYKPEVIVLASDGQRVRYTIKNIAEEANDYCAAITAVEGSHTPRVQYIYDRGQVAKKEYLDGRYQTTEYYRDGSSYSNGEIKVDANTTFLNRVAYQKAPVGHDISAVVTHRYFYYSYPKDKRKTQVYDANSWLTTYDSSNKRLDKITYHGPENIPQKRDRFYWSEMGNILCRSIENGNGEPQVCATYKYDWRGNVLEERLYGSLTGASHNPLFIYSTGIVRKYGGEQFLKTYTYSTKNIYNLVASESDGKKKITYAYKPQTNLLESKLTWDEQNVLRREFFQYNKSGCIARKINDDGCGTEQNDLLGVSERHITEYDHQNSPVVGLPSQVIQWVWNPATGAEEFVSKIAYTYTCEGWVAQEERFDSMGNSAGITTFSHDKYGNVSSKIDPLGPLYVAIR